MFSNVQFKLVARFLRIDGRIHARFPFVQHCQNSVVYVIVNENNAFGGAFYQVTYKLVSIIYLSVKKDALLIVFGPFVKLGKNLLNLVLCFQLANLKSVQALKNLGI